MTEQIALPTPSTSSPAASGWWNKLTENIPALFVLVTFVGMMTGLVADWQGQTQLAWVAYTIAYLTGGYYGLKGGVEALREFTLDIDLLMILAAAGAAVVGQPFEGVMLLFLFSLSNVLQAYALGRTRQAITALMQLRPDTALIQRHGQTLTLPLEKVQLNDQMVVKPGERLALDGVIAEGHGNLDQASVTGESVPVYKEAGAEVFAGTINLTGHLTVRVTKLAHESTLARMIQLVEKAQAEKAQTQTFIEKAEQYYAAGVILMTVAAMFIPLLWGEPFNIAFYRAITMMVAASPCALVISVPATLLSAIGNGARRGILFKGGAAVEQSAQIKVVAFDKTGTLTVGKPQVTHTQSLVANLPAVELLQLAAAIEAKSEHPLAQAVVTAAQQQGLELPAVTQFQAATGFGVTATVYGRQFRLGNSRFFKAETAGLTEALTQAETWQKQGQTVLFMAENEQMIGLLAVADVVRPEAVDVVHKLKAAGVEKVVMLTGDHHTVAQAIAQQAGIDLFYADLLPENKQKIVQELGQKYGPVAMVGDGVNDAPALATAALGIAMGAAGTDVALESADVVLMGDNLHHIAYLVALGRKTQRVMFGNLAFALFMIVLMLGTILVFTLPLPLAVLGHEGGTVLVSLNGLRLLAYNYKG